VSHLKERKEKICLNCHAVIYGKYCHVCGQENIEPRETFFGLITHFIYDITHFDGKFFTTLQLLLTQPGFLSKAFMQGRRASYLHPVKMYVFTSAFFFVCFFSFFNSPEEDLKVKVTNSVAEIKFSIDSSINDLNKKIGDSSIPASTLKLFSSKKAALEADLERLKTDTTKLDELNYFKDEINIFGQQRFNTTTEYLQKQQALPDNERDGWLLKQLKLQDIKARNKYGNDSTVLRNKLFDKFFHQFPQILFVSLPVFAMVLSLLYVRKRSVFYYADHGIYAVHLYIAMFLLLLFKLITDKLEVLPYLGWTGVVGQLAVVYMLYYQYRSMRYFYQQGSAKTLVKLILLNTTMLFIFMLLFVLFLLLSFFMV